MTDDTLLVERTADGVVRLTLNRPGAGNALTLPMARSLMEAVIACDEDPEVRCILLTGAGRLFCAGGDVAAFAEAGVRLPAFLKEITAYVHAAVVRLARTPKPVVVAVNGPVAGGGVGLALIGDIVLAAASSHFTLAYTGIGLSPDAGAAWLLPRLIGLRRAQELCLLNPRVDASEAARIGLVTRVVEDADLKSEAEALAATLAGGATAALGATRRLLLDASVLSLETHLDAEARSIAALSRTPDGREGVAAFLERRKPSFTGET
jgi:2-(1,2-epoxy-1,2-dihydrophenyl)acetyl-CoA isomerase